MGWRCGKGVEKWIPDLIERAIPMSQVWGQQHMWGGKEKMCWEEKMWEGSLVRENEATFSILTRADKGQDRVSDLPCTCNMSPSPPP